MNFSTALKLNDIDDYIAPSQSCIKPVKIPSSVGKTKSITIGEDGTYIAMNESGQQYSLSKANMDLNDCLACSGCITTAETILVAQHSSATFLDLLKKKETSHEIVVALSPQSIVSLCVAVSQSNELKSTFSGVKSPDEMRTFCDRLLRRHGVAHVIETTWSRDLSLAESAEEFVEAWKSVPFLSQSSTGPKLPIFSGICPGWVCYAEKTHFKVPAGDNNSDDSSSFLLQHLSKVRSPQQILAGLLKRPKEDNENGIFTVFVMPCFDKKLEASRSEFRVDINSDEVTGDVEKEADLVLGTNEFLTVIETLVKNGATLSQSSTASPHSHQRLTPLFAMADSQLATDRMYRHPGSGSGGYAVSVLRIAANHLFNMQLNLDIDQDDRVFRRSLGNSDMQEILLFFDSEACGVLRKQKLACRTPYYQLITINPELPTPLFAFLVANGFRNIQTVVQQLKRIHLKNVNKALAEPLNRFPFDYIEIMACPNGCLNGGAQLKVAQISHVSDVYLSIVVNEVMTSEHANNLKSVLEPATTHQNLHTTYRSVPKVDIINPLALKW